jgi:hypothetical protein
MEASIDCRGDKGSRQGTREAKAAQGKVKVGEEEKGCGGGGGDRRSTAKVGVMGEEDNGRGKSGWAGCAHSQTGGFS